MINLFELVEEIDKKFLEKNQQIANSIYESFLNVLDKNERERLEKLLVKIKSNF